MGLSQDRAVVNHGSEVELKCVWLLIDVDDEELYIKEADEVSCLPVVDSEEVKNYRSEFSGHLRDERWATETRIFAFYPRNGDTPPRLEEACTKPYRSKNDQLIDEGESALGCFDLKSVFMIVEVTTYKRYIAGMDDEPEIETSVSLYPPPA